MAPRLPVSKEHQYSSKKSTEAATLNLPSPDEKFWKLKTIPDPS